MGYYRKYMTEEDAFIIESDGYKYALKEKPDLASLEVLVKRKKDVKKTSQTVGIIFGIFLIPVFFIGILVIALCLANMNQIDINNDMKYECLYLNRDKKSVVFCSTGKQVWYEVDVGHVRDLYGKDGDGEFGIIVESSEDEQDYGELKLGYAFAEEKKAAMEKIKKLKEEKNDFEF